MRIAIEFELSARVKRAASALALVVAVGGVASAHAEWVADTSWIAANQPISASKLAALFAETDTRLEETAARLDHPVITKGGKSYSLGGVYCGKAMNTDGDIANGYAGAKVFCESVSGCSASAHMCSAEELVRTTTLGLPTVAGWYASGLEINGASNDCRKYTSNDPTHLGPVWSGPYPSTQYCNGSYPILCCD